MRDMFQSVKEFLEAARNARIKANDWKVKEKPIAEVEAMAVLQEQAEELIHSIKYEPWEKLFFRHFVLGETWEKAAVKIYISPSGAYKAVSKVYKQLADSEEWKRIQENRRGE